MIHQTPIVKAHRICPNIRGISPHDIPHSFSNRSFNIKQNPYDSKDVFLKVSR